MIAMCKVNGASNIKSQPYSITYVDECILITSKLMNVRFKQEANKQPCWYACHDFIHIQIDAKSAQWVHVKVLAKPIFFKNLERILRI